MFSCSNSLWKQFVALYLVVMFTLQKSLSCTFSHLSWQPQERVQELTGCRARTALSLNTCRWPAQLKHVLNQHSRMLALLRPVLYLSCALVEDSSVQECQSYTFHEHFFKKQPINFIWAFLQFEYKYKREDLKKIQMGFGHPTAFVSLKIFPKIYSWFSKACNVGLVLPPPLTSVIAELSHQRDLLEIPLNCKMHLPKHNSTIPTDSGWSEISVFSTRFFWET